MEEKKTQRSAYYFGFPESAALLLSSSISKLSPFSHHSTFKWQCVQNEIDICAIERNTIFHHPFSIVKYIQQLALASVNFVCVFDTTNSLNLYVYRLITLLCRPSICCDRRA